MNYYVVAIRAVPQSLVDILTHQAFAAGCAGIEEPLEFIQEYDNYEPQIIHSEKTQLLIYFENPPQADFIEYLREKHSLVPSILQQPHKDWLHEWKKGFHSFEIVPNYWVVPSWEEPDLAGGVAIKMDPGMAFGTGTHETTQLVAQLLFNQLQNHVPRSLLDVGCGTGILSILAAHYEVKKISATEVDSAAAEVAIENFAKNHVTVEMLDSDLSKTESCYEWVVANIIDGVLTELKPDLVRLCTSDLFLSGIVEERQSVFEEKFLKDLPFQVTDLTRKGEWVAYHLKRS